MSEFVSSGLHFILALLGLNACVFVHELGHWLFAKWHKMRTPVFSIGFGPREYSLVLGRMWDTEFRISPIPLGGYVKIESVGEDADGESDTVDVPHYAIWRRATVLFAGVLFNVLFAIAILWGVLLYQGTYDGYDVTVQSLSATGPNGDLRVDDVIYSVAGNRIDSSDDLMGFEANKPVALQIERGDDQLEVAVIADADGNLGIENVAMEASYATIGPVDALTQSASATFGGLKQVLGALGSISHVSKPVEGASASELRGIIGIVEIGTASAAAGFISLLMFVVTMNINLAVMNLLPLPLLDGGHILFLAVEKLRGRPLSAKVQNVVFGIGAAFLFSFMLWALKNDIVGLLKDGLTLKSGAILAGLVALIIWFVKDCLKVTIKFGWKTEGSEDDASVEAQVQAADKTEALPGNDSAGPTAPLVGDADTDAAAKKETTTTTKS